MRNISAVLVAILISCGILAGHQSLASGLSTGVAHISTHNKQVAAVMSTSPVPKPAANGGSLKPNWFWTTTVNVYGYTKINGSFGATINKFVDRVVIESDTKGFSWSATWNRASYQVQSRV